MRDLRTFCRFLAVAAALTGPAQAQQDTRPVDLPPPEAAPLERNAAEARPAEVRISDRVVLVRDPTMRSIQFTMVVRAGCADEPEMRCRGIAHYLEHLLLVGRNADHTETAFRFFPDGTSNGWTSDRATGYIHRFPKRDTAEADVEKLFSFYANRLRGFEVSAEDAERERLCGSQRLLARVTVRQNTGKHGHLRDPAAILFAIQIDTQIHALASDEGPHRTTLQKR